MATIEEFRQAKVRRATKGVTQTQWFIKEVSDHVNITMRQRMGIVTGFLKNKTILNIKKPVTRVAGIVTRSVEGEFPRADTTQLMRTLISEVVTVSPGIVDGFVGSPLDYSLILEQRLDRRFLSRTLEEELQSVKKILVGKEITFTKL